MKHKINYPAPVQRQINALIRAGRRAPEGSNASVVGSLLEREADILAAVQAGKTSVGCALGFRKAAKFCTKAELDSLNCGESFVGLKALIFHGVHPGWWNGGGVPRPFRLVNGRVVRIRRKYRLVNGQIMLDTSK